MEPKRIKKGLTMLDPNYQRVPCVSIENVEMPRKVGLKWLIKNLGHS